MTRDGVYKELSWKPRAPWADAGAKWKDADTLVIEYTPAGTSQPAVVERRLSDPSWQRSPPP